MAKLFATERAQVRYAGGANVLDSVIAAAEKAGYPAAPVRTDAARDDREKEARTAELARLQRALIVAAIATLPLLVFEMGSHLFDDLHHYLTGQFGEDTIKLISFVLASIVQFGPGRVFYQKGWPALTRAVPEPCRAMP